LHNQLQRRVELRFLPLPNEPSRKANTGSQKGVKMEKKEKKGGECGERHRHRGSWMFVSRILCVSVSCTRTSCVPRTERLKKRQTELNKPAKAARNRCLRTLRIHLSIFLQFWHAPARLAAPLVPTFRIH